MNKFRSFAHRTNVIIVAEIKGVQFTLKSLHYLTVPSHVGGQDQHHNFLRKKIYYKMTVMGRECRYLSLKLVQSQVPHACLRYKITFESALSLGFFT